MLSKIFNVFLQHKSPALVLLLSLIAFVSQSWVSEFEFNRTEIYNLQLWRLFTGHFFHTNGNHLLLNGLATLLLWAMHGHFYTTKKYTLLFITCALTTSVALLLFSSLNLYVGLSGVLHGVFLWGALKDIEVKEKTGYLLVVGLIAKISHEQLYGPSESVKALIDANVAIDAHLYGALGGLIFYLAGILFNKLKQPARSKNKQ